jgi:hypothetical protein
MTATPARSKTKPTTRYCIHGVPVTTPGRRCIHGCT